MKQSPSVGLPGQYEGTVSFPSQDSHPFRYRLTASNGELHFWLEDRKTKHQWESDRLKMTAFANDENIIPNAVFSDYVSCFQKCLESVQPEEFSRDLVFGEANTMELQLTLKIKVFDAMWCPSYHFNLKKISLKDTDVLEAKIRDLQESVDRVEARQNDQSRRLWFQAETVDSKLKGQFLQFVRTSGFECNDKISIQQCGRMFFNVDGLFMISGAIVHTSSQQNCVCFEVYHNEAVVVSPVDFGTAYQQTTTFAHILTVAKNDSIAIKYSGNSCAHPGSYIVVTEMP